MQIPSITIETAIVTVNKDDIPLAMLNGIVTTPPINPMQVMMLNKTKSVGRSCPKNCLFNFLSFSNPAPQMNRYILYRKMCSLCTFI